MGKTATVACPKCEALNDLVIFEGTFEDNGRRAAFSFACRVCGAALPEGLPPAEAQPLPGADDEIER
jgi:uncharacterized Zn-binding protein involved in type VI secretion